MFGAPTPDSPFIPTLKDPIAEPAPVFQSSGMIIVPPVVMKKGKWVVYEDHVGIIAGMKEFPAIEVHFVDKNGETVTSAMVNYTHVRLAKHLEIPEKRRHEDPIYAAMILGYV